MTLEDWANASQILGAVGSIGVAVLVYIWQRKATRAQTGATFAEQMRHYNMLVLEDAGLQQFEAERHPYGREMAQGFTAEDAKTMYRFFILLNVVRAMHVAKRSGAIDDLDYNAVIRNTANMTFRDREFIRAHCFPRGYTRAFRDQFEEKWKRREENGGVPIMDHD
jgi:hypothetical protein